MSAVQFWAKTNRSGDCWLWTGAQTKGYGQCTVDKRHGYAHRFAWELEYGAIPKGMNVCHKCDVPLCINPQHLFLGTSLDNVRDKVAKGRGKSGILRGSANGFSKLDETTVSSIKRKYLDGGVTIYSLADEFGVCKSTIYCIVSGQTWRQVNGF